MTAGKALPPLRGTLPSAGSWETTAGQAELTRRERACPSTGAASTVIWRSNTPTPSALSCAQPPEGRFAPERTHERRKKPCRNPAQIGHRHLLCQPRHQRDTLRRRAGPECRHALRAGPAGERVVTGMADGYYRIKEKPAATLLHCGPGLAERARKPATRRRAHSGIVNIVGDQATHHRPLDAPLWQIRASRAHRVGLGAHQRMPA